MNTPANIVHLARDLDEQIMFFGGSVKVLQTLQVRDVDGAVVCRGEGDVDLDA